MNDRLFRTILKRYEANIEDALYTIHCIDDHNIVIPDHVDITDAIDKQLDRVASNEDQISDIQKSSVSQDKTKS